MKIRPLYTALGLVLCLFFTALLSSQAGGLVEKSHQCVITAAVSSFGSDFTDLDGDDLVRAASYYPVLIASGQTLSFPDVNTTFNFTSFCQAFIRAPPGLS